jgi:hypothetical protein
MHVDGSHIRLVGNPRIFLLQFQLPFAKSIIAYVLRKCEHLVGVMVFGHKAAGNILPWLRRNFSQQILIQSHGVFLSHPQNIQWC